MEDVALKSMSDPPKQNYPRKNVKFITQLAKKMVLYHKIGLLFLYNKLTIRANNSKLELNQQVISHRIES